MSKQELPEVIKAFFLALSALFTKLSKLSLSDIARATARLERFDTPDGGELRSPIVSAFSLPMLDEAIDQVMDVHFVGGEMVLDVKNADGLHQAHLSAYDGRFSLEPVVGLTQFKLRNERLLRISESTTKGLGWVRVALGSFLPTYIEVDAHNSTWLVEDFSDHLILNLFNKERRSVCRFKLWVDASGDTPKLLHEELENLNGVVEVTLVRGRLLARDSTYSPHRLWWNGRWIDLDLWTPNLKTAHVREGMLRLVGGSQHNSAWSEGTQLIELSAWEPDSQPRFTSLNMQPQVYKDVYQVYGDELFIIRYTRGREYPRLAVASHLIRDMNDTARWRDIKGAHVQAVRGDRDVYLLCCDQNPKRMHMKKSCRGKLLIYPAHDPKKDVKPVHVDDVTGNWLRVGDSLVVHVDDGSRHGAIYLASELFDCPYKDRPAPQRLYAPFERLQIVRGQILSWHVVENTLVITRYESQVSVYEHV